MGCVFTARWISLSSSRLMARVALLRAEPAVKSIAGDLRVTPMMAVSDKAMASDQARAGSLSLLGLGFPGVTGKGVGVVVVDSGISPPQRARQQGGRGREASFPATPVCTISSATERTSQASSRAARRRPRGFTKEYTGGVAPGAHLINVRVLDARGTGYSSTVIAGLDWVLANRTRYGIRVVNLSLGHPVTGPCVLDPMCTTVGRLVQSGLVVVVSAGNRGKSASGQPVVGTVTSPGNSPAALTVGALNTWGTVARGDDTVTSYSSRGMSPYDFGVKPDLVAPGNKIVSLETPDSYLASKYAAQHVAGSGRNAYYG
jgi:serine protease AprX